MFHFRAFVLFRVTTEQGKICHIMNLSLELSKVPLPYDKEKEIFQSTPLPAPIAVLLCALVWQNAGMETKITNTEESDVDKVELPPPKF